MPVVKAFTIKHFTLLDIPLFLCFVFSCVSEYMIVSEEKNLLWLGISKDAVYHVDKGMEAGNLSIVVADGVLNMNRTRGHDER